MDVEALAACQGPKKIHPSNECSVYSTYYSLHRSPVLPYPACRGLPWLISLVLLRPQASAANGVCVRVPLTRRVPAMKFLGARTTAIVANVQVSMTHFHFCNTELLDRFSGPEPSLYGQCRERNRGRGADFVPQACHADPQDNGVRNKTSAGEKPTPDHHGSIKGGCLACFTEGSTMSTR